MKDGTRATCECGCGNETQIDQAGRPRRFLQGHNRRNQGCGWIEGGYRYSMKDGEKVAEHREVMEKELGRPLLSNEVVHHHDANKLNNSVENLTVLSRDEHQRLHQLGAERKRWTKDELRRACELRRKGMTIQEIALVLGRPFSSTAERLAQAAPSVRKAASNPADNTSSKGPGKGTDPPPLASCSLTTSPSRDETPRLFVGRHPWQQENMERNGDSLERLADRLLSIGGVTVVVPPDNPSLAKDELPHMLRFGQTFDANLARLESGEPSGCHANSARLWRTGRGAICTGFALSGGMWRSHSWVHEPTGRLIETTMLRDAYFGYELDDESASVFADTN